MRDMDPGDIEQAIYPRDTVVVPRRLSFDAFTRDASWSRPPERPLQFPSLEHFRQATARATTHACDVDGLKPSTTRWAERSVRLFERFLLDTNLARDFLSGEVNRQLRTLAAFVAWQRQRGLSRTTINNTWRGCQRSS